MQCFKAENLPSGNVAHSGLSLRVPVNHRLVASSVLLISLVFLPACAMTDRNQPRVFQGEGLITALDANENTVTIKHQEIKGFMAAMTMPFKVKPPVSLSGFSKNDRVRFELTVTAEESWISKLEYTGHIEETTHAGTGPNAPPPTPLNAGDLFPDFTLTDQDGKKWSLSDVRGKAVAITFIFTRCPLPEFCPRASTNFATTQNNLSPEIGDRFHLISITLDPGYDTPSVLKKYGQIYYAEFSRWSFLTGKEEAIRKVTDNCGVRFWQEEGSVTHSVATAIIAPDGKLFRLYQDNSVAADQIAADLKLLVTTTAAVQSSAFRLLIIKPSTLKRER